MPGKKGSKTSIKKSVSRFFKRDTKDDSDTSKTDSKDDSETSDSKKDSKVSEEDSKDESKDSDVGKKEHITKEEAETLSHLAALSGTIEHKVWGWGVAGTLWKRARDIRAKPPIDWLPYLENQFITQREFAFITAFQFAQTKDERDLTLAYFKDLSYKTIVKVVQCVCVVKEIEQFLVLIDDTLSEDLGKVLKFTDAVEEPWKAFYHLLRCSNEFVRNISSRIITKLIFGTKPVHPLATEVEFFLEWLKDEIEESNEYLHSVARCLQRLLQVDDYRLAFMRLNGISKIVKILTCDLSPQAQYQFCFCLWVTTFNPQLTEKLNRTKLIPILMDILGRCPSEISKIPRVVTATFRNLLEKPRDVLIRRSNALLMIQCKLLQCMDIMEGRTDLKDDPEYIEDFNIVRDILSACVTELTSFDEYYMELKSGRLKWSVVHTSKRFWVENAHRMNDNKYELLQILIDILDQSKDHTVLCIAAHDIGEYAKHYKRGKLLVSRMGGKDALVKLLYHRHPAVKFHALKSLQVLMLDEHELYTTGKDGISERTSDKIGFGL